MVQYNELFGRNYMINVGEIGSNGTDVREAYFRSLESVFGLSEGPFVGGYQHLISELHRWAFVASHPMDDNRAGDGKELRSGWHIPPMEPCSFLEMLLGVAIRIEYQLDGGCYSSPASNWFWVLINNLGLAGFTDDEFERGGWNAEMVRTVVSRVNNRSYNSDGVGGLFPLKDAREDQKKVEIWYQMHAWLIENGYFNSGF